MRPTAARLLTVTLLLLAVQPAVAAPKAYFLEMSDKWTSQVGLGHLLSAAGFEAEALPFDKSPADLEADLIALGSFVSEHPQYDAYVEKHGAALAEFVEQGGVLLQFTQADQTEGSPAFLPDGLKLRRCDTDPKALYAMASEHPLVEPLLRFRRGAGEPAELRFSSHHRGGNWEVFDEQKGFRVLLASSEDGRLPALVEASHGKGRFVLTSTYFDKLLTPEGEAAAPADYLQAGTAFTRALAGYVAQVKTGKAPQVVATAPVKDPEPAPFVEGSWTLAVLPDTQVYSMRYPQHFKAQTKWLAENAEKHNVKYVVHLGDIVNNNNAPQWENARDAMKTLNGVVPYSLSPGNHDYGPGGNAATRDTLLNEYFPMEWFADRPTLGGVMEEGKIDNSYHTFEAGGQKWLVLALEWGPRDQTVEWANQVVARKRDHHVIMTTHAYVYFDSTRYDWKKYGKQQSWNPHGYGTASKPGGVNDGQELWEKLVSRHPNFFCTLNGHVLGDGLGKLSSKTRHGNVVHQMLVNYQMKREGGEGFMRLMEFLPDGKTVQVKAYSPVLDEYKTDPQNQFTLELTKAK